MINTTKMTIVILIVLGILVLVTNTVDLSSDNMAKVTIQNEDEEFMRLVKESGYVLHNDRLNIAKALEKNDTKNLTIYARTYKDNSEKYTYQMKDLSLTPSHQRVFDEYMKYLNNVYLTGKYIEEGAGISNQTMIYIGYDYNDMTNENIANINRLINETMS